MLLYNYDIHAIIHSKILFDCLISADFFQLLFVCLQWNVFRIEKSRAGSTYPGGDNYEATVDVENISENPVPNFVFNR